MTDRFDRKRRPFVTLPRHRRGNEVVRLKGRIRRDAAVYGGRYTSHHVPPDPDRPDLCCQWDDFQFPGRDRFTWWNAEMITARMAFWDAVWHLAFDRAYAQLDACEQSREFSHESVPATVSPTGKVLTVRMIWKEPVRYEQFGGLTFSEYKDRLKAQIIRDEPPVIHESFRMDRSYSNGVGLRIVLDVDRIDRPSIEAAIDRFFAVGETDWQSPQPVPRDRLPTVTKDEALKALDLPWSAQLVAVR